MSGKRMRMAKRSSRSKTKNKLRLTPAQWQWISGLLLLGIGLITLLSLVSPNHGRVTMVWVGLLQQVIGWAAFVSPLFFLLAGVSIITRLTERPLQISASRVAGGVVLLISLLALSSQKGIATDLEAGGLVGHYIAEGLVHALGAGGSIVILAIGILVGATLLLDLSVAEVVASVLWLYGQVRQIMAEQSLVDRREPKIHIEKDKKDSNNKKKETDREKESAPEETVDPEVVATPEQTLVRDNRRPASALRGATFPSTWSLPNIDQVLVAEEDDEVDVEDVRNKAKKIETTLASLGVPATVVEVNPGPVVTQYGVEPGYVEKRGGKRSKVKVSRISALSNDLALALAASPVRIEAPVPGKGFVGVEVPNSNPRIVRLAGVMRSDEFQAKADHVLTVALGRDVSGRPVVVDLGSLPHLLIAGATGTGKSVCINALISCLLCQNRPDQLRLVLIDPKRVELSIYESVPHLLGSVVIEAAEVIKALRWLTQEMDRRYRLFVRAGRRDLAGYNEWALTEGHFPLPYIVVFIDELADLMMAAADEVERYVCRIAQLARATGIHMVIATQRPSVDVVTGLIKANFPARLSFAMSSQVDSRVILDAPGAEKLLGKGDGLYVAPDSAELVRVQGSFIAEPEIKRLVNHWSAQATRPEYDSHLSSGEEDILKQQPLWPEMEPKDDVEQAEGDPLFNEALGVLVQEGKASISLLQRRLHIGYTRAARIMDELAERQLVGPPTGSSKPREVLVDEEDLI